MEYRAPSRVVKDLENEVRRVLRTVDLLKESRMVRETLATLNQSLHDARIYTTDYELSETREEQLGNAKQAKNYLETASKAILTASQYDIFGAIDVAHLSAVIEQVKVDLK